MLRLVPVNAIAPVDRWRGERDDDGLAALADELALKGPVQRLKAALDSVAEKADSSERGTERTLRRWLGRSPSACSFPRWNATCAGPSSWRWRVPPRRSASTRSGSATTCSIATTAARTRTVGRVDDARGPRRVDRARASRSLVACSAFHPPGLLARMAATIDEVSGGRFVLGIGAGWNQTGVRRVRDRLRGARVAFRGGVRDRPSVARRRACHLRGTFLARRGRRPAPEPRRRVPLMIGSNGDRVLRARSSRRRVEHVVRRLRQHARPIRGVEPAHQRPRGRGGRASSEVTRSACALVVLDRDAGERPIDGDVVPLEGRPRSSLTGSARSPRPAPTRRSSSCPRSASDRSGRWARS